MQYLSVKNLETYQHYKDRDPKWIKLYYSILDDPGFMMLNEIMRCRYMTCLIIASRCQNKIPLDPQYLKKVMRLDKAPDLQPLVNTGFLILSSTSLDNSYTDAPVPNVPLLSSPLLNSLNSPDPKSTKHAKKGNGVHPLPEDWTPKESHQKLAGARKLDLPIEAAHFRGKATELEWVTKNWDQKFTNWMLQEVKYRQRRT